INEPTAAALDYGMQNLNQCENMLVYDFGGGTLDVTVLEFFEGVADVKASCGNNHLGGKDLDEALEKHLAGADYAKIQADPRAAIQLKKAAIDCKIALGLNGAHRVTLPFLTQGVTIDRLVTQEEFEKTVLPLIRSTQTQIETALADAGLNASDLRKVMLVGGSTRIPSVKRTVAEILGFEPVSADFPELAVARGAAIQAAIIEGSLAQEEAVVLTDVCPFTLGAKILTNFGLCVDPLIKRNSSIPCEFRKVYIAVREYQSAVKIEAYQGESDNVHENTFLGEFELSGLPKRRGELAEVEVTFAYDLNGILHITAAAIGNNKSETIHINMSEPVAMAPVKLSEWESVEGAKKYRPLMKKASKLADKYIGEPEFVDDDLYVVTELSDSLKAALLRNQPDEAEKIALELSDFVNYWNERDEISGKLGLDDIIELAKKFKKIEGGRKP
ncbi:MAG: Hsp70 family protein, partial [Oscillospiraceae bacterium]|nr:Hsp70 family protein [Oscillospiraceae bacterium]